MWVAATEIDYGKGPRTVYWRGHPYVTDESSDALQYETKEELERELWRDLSPLRGGITDYKSYRAVQIDPDK